MKCKDSCRNTSMNPGQVLLIIILSLKSDSQFLTANRDGFLKQFTLINTSLKIPTNQQSNYHLKSTFENSFQYECFRNHTTETTLNSSTLLKGKIFGKQKCVQGSNKFKKAVSKQGPSFTKALENTKSEQELRLQKTQNPNRNGYGRYRKIQQIYEESTNVP